MPAARRRVRRRRRYPRYRGVSRWSQYNTLRTKCEYSTTLQFPNGQQAGQPYFQNTPNNNRSWINFAVMMQRYAKNDALREMFAWVSVSGIKIETVPHSTNISTNLGNQSTVCLAVLPGVNDEQNAMTYNELIAVNTSLLLDPMQRQSRYWSWRGGQFDMKVSADQGALTAGQMVCRAMYDGIYTQTNAWTVKVTLYLYWRYAKVV